MSINLTKQEVTIGERINLTKEEGEALVKLYVGTGWDAKRYDGEDFDVDLYAFLLDENGKCLGIDYFIAGGGPRAFVKDNGEFYDHDPERAVLHTGDNVTGIGDGDDESLTIEFAKLNPRVKKIVCIDCIYQARERGQKFGDIDNAFFHATNPDTGKDWNFDLSEDYDKKTAIVGFEIYLHNGQWKMKAVGDGYEKDVLELCTEYGLDAAY